MFSGPKQQRNFKNLMLNRIKWNEEIIGEKKDNVDKDAQGERNQCTLVSFLLSIGSGLKSCSFESGQYLF